MRRLRFAATLAGEAALFVGSFGLGRIAAGAALAGASRLGVAVASKAGAAAAVRGAVLGTSGAAAVDAGAGAALASLKARLIGGAADAIGQAAVLEVGDAALNLRTPTVGGFALNAATMGAFGIALHGIGRARLKLGDRGFEEARRLVLANPALQNELGDSVRFAQLYARHAGKTASEATDDIFKLLAGQGSGDAARLALDVLADNPAFLKPGRDLGTVLAAQIRGTLPGAQLVPTPGSNRLLVTYHDAANPAIETTADLSFPVKPTIGPSSVFEAGSLRAASKTEKAQHRTLNTILDRARKGEIRINKVVGDDSLIAPFDQFRSKRGPLAVELAEPVPAEAAAAIPEERVLNLDDFHARQREELLLVADDLAAQARKIESEISDLATEFKEVQSIPGKLAAQARAEGLPPGGFTDPAALVSFKERKGAIRKAAVAKLARRKELADAVAEVAKQADALPGGEKLDPLLAGLRERQVAPTGIPLAVGDRVSTGAGEAVVLAAEHDPRGAVWRVGEDVGIGHPGKNGKPLTPRVDRTAAAIILSPEERAMLDSRAIAWTTPDSGVMVTRPAGRGVIELEDGLTGSVSRWKTDTIATHVEHKALVPLSGKRLSETNAEIARRSLIVKQSRSARGFVEKQFQVAEQLGALGQRLEARTPAERLAAIRALTPDDVVDGGKVDFRSDGDALSPINDSLGFLARALDAEARALSDGRVAVRYKWGDVTYGSKGAAFRALREVQLHNVEVQRLVAAAQRVAETDTFPHLPGLLDTSDVLPGAPLDDEMELLGRHLGGESGTDLPVIRSFERVITRLARAGDVGVDAAALLYSTNRMRLQASGTVLSEFERIFATLTPEEIAYGAVDAIKRGLPARPEVVAAHRRLNEILHKYLRTEAALGESVAPFVPDYIPVVNDAETMALLRAGLEDVALGRAESKASLVAKDIVGQLAKERGVSIKQATLMVKRAVQNQQPRSGHLAFEREVALPGLQMRNLRSIYTVAALRDARDVAAVKVLGAGHARWDALLQKMDQATRLEAMRAYDSVLGRGRSEMPAIAEAIYNFQRTKLTFSGLANIVQNVNTAQVAGIRNFAAAMWDLFNPKQAVQGFPEFRAARQRALDSGVLAHGLSGLLEGDDVHRFITKNEMAVVQKSLAGRVKAGYEHVASLPLRVTDIFNRTVAQRTGEIMFDRILARLDDTGFAILDDLGFKREIIQRAAGDRELREMLRLEVAAKVTERAQFTASALNLPAAGVSPITRNLRGTRVVATEKTFFGSETGNYFQDSVWGRFLWQFQNFTMNQSAFMWRETTAGFSALQKAATGKGGIAALLRDPRALVATLRRPDVAPHMKRSAKFIAALMTAYPMGGALAVKTKAALAGPNVASQQLAALAEDDDFLSWLAYWNTATAAGGGLGLAGDLAASVVTRNLDDVKSLFAPAALGTVTDAAFTMSSGLRFASTGETEELERASRFFLGQVGGSPGRALAALVVPR